MAAQRRDSDRGESRGELRLIAGVAGASTPAPGDGLDAARGIGWGMLVAMVGFWAPMLALTWKWLHR